MQQVLMKEFPQTHDSSAICTPALDTKEAHYWAKKTGRIFQMQRDNRELLKTRSNRAKIAYSEA